MEVEECHAAHHPEDPLANHLDLPALDPRVGAAQAVAADSAELFEVGVVVEEASAEEPHAAAAEELPQEEDHQLQDLHQPCPHQYQLNTQPYPWLQHRHQPHLQGWHWQQEEKEHCEEGSPCCLTSLFQTKSERQHILILNLRINLEIKFVIP